MILNTFESGRRIIVFGKKGKIILFKRRKVYWLEIMERLLALKKKKDYWL